MNRKSILFALLGVVMIMTSACEKDEVLTPEAALIGKWIVQSSEILAQTVPGDGSYLSFNTCSGTTCTGVDYKASDQSSGTFTYELSADATTITISDSTSEGGNYNATWDILELTGTNFRIVGNTILGSLKIEMVKE